MNLALSIARNRGLQKLFSPFLPQTAAFEVIREIQIEIPLQDQTGPAFYLNHGGPQAFYHYEEVEKVEILRGLPMSGVFLDIGANIGLFSTYVAKLLPKTQCFAFEPNPLLAQCLRKTVEKSPFPQIHVQEVCLSDKVGSVDLYLHKRNSGGHSMIDSSIDLVERDLPLSVQSTTLDRWMQQAPISKVDAIKMDVQGAELLVLQGAKDTILKSRPLLLIEIENENLLKEINAGSKWMADLFENFSIRIAGENLKFGVVALPEIAKKEIALGHLHSNYVFTPN